MNIVRNDADTFKDVLNDLNRKKQEAEDKYVYGRELYRLFELTETSIATMLKSKKKDYVDSFAKNILDDEFHSIISKNKIFGNGLMRALLAHAVDEHWANFFNVYDFLELDETYVYEVFERLMKNASVLKTSADHSMMNSFLSYMMSKDFHKISELNDEEVVLTKIIVNSIAVSEETV